MEVWDTYDAKGRKTGRTVKRGDLLPKGEYHIVVHILPYNDDKYLVQKRSKTKETHPSVWAVTGGSALRGENSLQAAIRETHEELGIAINPSEFVKIRRLILGNSLADIWMFECGLSIQEIDFNTEEVEELKWLSFGEIMEMVEGGIFHDYGREYLSVLERRFIV